MNQSTFYEVRPGYAVEITPSASRQGRFRSHLHVETFDPRTGQAILLTAPDGRTMLADVGDNSQQWTN